LLLLCHQVINFHDQVVFSVDVFLAGAFFLAGARLRGAVFLAGAFLDIDELEFGRTI